MKVINLNSSVIISFICLFFLSCSSTQLIDISKEDQLDLLINNIGDTQLKINTSEDIKILIIKSLVALGSDIKIDFVEKVDGETLLISNDFLNQEFIYFCKSANAYLEQKTKQYIFSSNNDDSVFVFYDEIYKSQAKLFQKQYPGAEIIKLDGDYNDLVRNVFGLSESYGRSDVINRLVQDRDINFIPRSREDFKKVYIIAGYNRSKNLVPSLRFNYILDKEIYISAQAIIEIEDRKKLLDFSDVILTVPNSFIEQDISSNLNELSKLSFLQDLIIVSAINRNNGNSQNIAGKYANIRYSQNACSDMNMNLVKVDNLGQFNLL